MSQKIGKVPFGLYVILTNPVVGYEACARAAIDEGIRFLQLRMKNVSRNEIVDTAKRLRKLTSGTGTLFIVNDDLDIAMETDADGIHLGQNDMDIDDARKTWGDPGKIYGLSTHNPDQAAAALKKSPDYIGVGPVFPTPTKAMPDHVVGGEMMGQIIRSTPLPAVAIG